MEVVSTTTRRAFRGTSGKMASLHEAGLDSGNHSPLCPMASGNVSPPMPACRCSDHMAGVGVVSEAGVGAPQWVSRGRPAAVVETDTGLTPNRGGKAGRGRVRRLLQNRPTT